MDGSLFREKACFAEKLVSNTPNCGSVADRWNLPQIDSRMVMSPPGVCCQIVVNARLVVAILVEENCSIGFEDLHLRSDERYRLMAKCVREEHEQGRTQLLCKQVDA
jgi:hypothetical protein